MPGPPTKLFLFSSFDERPNLWMHGNNRRHYQDATLLVTQLLSLRKAHRNPTPVLIHHCPTTTHTSVYRYTTFLFCDHKISTRVVWRVPCRGVVAALAWSESFAFVLYWHCGYAVSVFYAARRGLGLHILVSLRVLLLLQNDQKNTCFTLTPLCCLFHFTPRNASRACFIDSGALHSRGRAVARGEQLLEWKAVLLLHYHLIADAIFSAPSPGVCHCKQAIPEQKLLTEKLVTKTPWMTLNRR